MLGLEGPRLGQLGGLSPCRTGELEVLAYPPLVGAGLGLKLAGLLMFPLPEPGREAVLSGVGLQVDSLDSSSSEEDLGSPFFPPLLPVLPLVPPLALPDLEFAARSCLRNLARLFWNQT